MTQFSNKKIVVVGIIATVCTVAIGIVASQMKPYQPKRTETPPQVQNTPSDIKQVSQDETQKDNQIASPSPTPALPTTSPQQQTQETTPNQQTPTNPTSSTYNETRKTYLKVFDLTINENGFNPYQIVVHQNDQLQINIKAGEKATDIVSRGLDVSINTLQSGQSHVLIIDAYRQGDFIFECSKACPGTQKTIGKLSVIPPQQ